MNEPVLPPKEPKNRESIWLHPYLIYIVLTGVLFLGLVIMAGLALSNGWLPDRGIHS